MTDDAVWTAASRAPKFTLDPRLALMRSLLRRIGAGHLHMALPSGAVLHSADYPGPEASVQIHRLRALRRLLLGGDIGFAESFVDGDWSSPDLVALLRFGAANRGLVDTGLAGSPLARLFNRLAHGWNANSRRGSRRNIMRHYDLGNEFFALWLDPSMLYSSALWLDEAMSLEEAQQAKLDRITQLLGLTGGEDVLEIGCGWGALAQRLAEAGAHVVGLTLSPAQLAFARARIADSGQAEKVDLRLQDYRDVDGAFDRIVSIEMIEAVGEAFWPAYFGQIARRLKPGGRALIQAIVIDDQRFETYRARPDFIQRHIFPGGFLPCDAAVRAQAQGAGLRVASVERFGLSYAETLREWRRRFEARWPEIEALGFDEKFRRLWTYYLCYCEAGFREGATDVRFYLLESPQ